MISSLFFFLIVSIQVITSQRIQPYPQLFSETIVERYTPKYPPQSPAENDVLCKNLATAIQNAVFDRFSQNCQRRPVFGPIAGPLIGEIKNSLCSCPLCSAVNLSPNGYSKTYVSPSTVSSVIKNSTPTIVSRGPASVGVTRKYNDLMSLVNTFTSCDCGCRGPI